MTRLRLLLALVLVALTLAVVPGLTAPAAADPAVSVSQDIPAQTLVGRETAVEVTFSNGGTDPAYNLAFSVSLPLGVSVSSSDESPTRVITETDAGGDPTGTVVVWENLVDINPGSYFRFRYSLAYELGSGPALWEVGETAQAPVTAYVSASEPVRPTITAQTSGSQTTAVADDFAESGTGAGETTLVPLLLEKSEPSVEAELLRGVHDHQTVYSITAETGSDPSGVDVGEVEDWIPAGLEFLGCGTEDNSAGEEYPGSGPLNPGNAPALPLPCPDPVLVETVDSGLPAGLDPGVYTHVVWDIGTTLAPDATVGISYVAGIPQRENTTTWPGTAPAPASLAQGSNLDNNTGADTTQVGEGTTYRNQVQVDTTFQGTDTTVTATEDVEAVDLSVHKFVDTPEIDQGAVSAWQLYLETSEYVVEGGVAGLTLVDVAPDGTCPIGSVNPRCTVTQPDPVPDYTSSSYDAGSGETTLTWDLSTETLGRSETFIVGFSTEALTSYVNGAPVSANDSWVNTVDLDAQVTTFGPGGPDDPATQQTQPVEDDSSQEQSGSALAFAKDVARPADGQTCGDGTGLDWRPDAVTGTGPGDRVCFRLTAVPPSSLDTIDATMTDFLPPGFRYETGSAEPGPDNEVPEENVVPASVTGTPAAGQRIDWTLLPTLSVEPAQTAQVVFAAILDGGVTPDLVVSGDQAVNDARVSFQNTNGEVFVQRDDAAVGLTEAHLDLAKGVAEVDPPAAPPTTYAPPVDTARDVVGGSVVTYEVTVTNDGTSDVIGVEVHDLLADNDQGVAGQDAVCGAITAVSDDGDCAGGTLTWTDLDVPAGGSITLSYSWTMPDPVDVGASWTNTAGVVEYRSTTNTGPDYVYVPRDNVDPAREPDANTDPADDDAHLAAPGISMTKTRTTAIDEAGNAAPDQATIGETISYVVETRQGANTVATDYELVDDLTDRGLVLDPGSVDLTLATADPGDPCVYGAPGVPGATVDVTGDTITVSGAGGTSSPQDRCIRLRFDAVVQDVPDAGSEPLNVRPGVVRNEATLTYTAGGGGRSVTAGVDTQVVEPQIAVSKRALTTSAVLPGTRVDYEVIVTNVSGAQVSVAHDVQVADTWDPAWGPTVVANPDGGTTGSGSISWTIPSLAPGASRTLRYSLELAGDLPAGQDLTNTVTAVTSSRAATPAAERDDASPCSPATCPGYEDDASATITVGGPSITKTVLRPLHTIGDVATYRIEAFFPAHLDFGPTPVTVTDDLAGGATTYLRTVSATCTGCSDPERLGYAAPEDNGSAATTPTWDFGVLPAAAVARRVFLTFEVRVEDDPAVGAGDTLTNTASLTYVNGTLTDTAEIDIAEPDVTLVKRVASSVEPTPRTTTPGTPVSGEVGGTVTYELEVTNDGDWTAYDVLLTDEPDSLSSGGSCTGDARLGVVDVSPGTGWRVTDGTLGTGDACLGFRVPTLLPGRTVVITYELSVPDDFPRADLVAGPELVNTAAVTQWFGLVDGDRAGNPDVRDYPAAPVEDEGHVDLAGAAFGDLVWLDVDGDGLGPDTGDTTEPGIAGVTVTITGPSGTLTRVTDADGRWLTDDGSVPPDWLAAGTYTVEIATATLPPGLANTADPDGGLDSTADTTLAENEVDLTQDFGYAGEQSLGDRVWLDLDLDGVQDAGEPGLADVDLTAVWVGPDGDVPYGTVTTDATGGYVVTGLPAGRVEVTVDVGTLPAGVAATYDLDGGLDDTAARVLAAGEDATDVDFGYGGTGAVGDLVWLDRDADGVADPAEPGLPDIDLVVTWAGPDGTLGNADDVAYPAATTGPAGGYLVDGLPAGDVLVEVQTATLPGGLDQTYDADGVLDDSTVRTLAPGQTDRDADFGYTGQHTVGDLVWLDVDADGNGPDTPTVDAEPGIPGQPVAVRWSGGDGTFGTPDDVVLAVPLTDADGRWTVTGVPDGPVRATLQGGPAADLTVTADPDGTLDGRTERPVTADDLGFDFGLAGTGSVGDLVWLDVDDDGVDDPGEPPVPGVDVGVTWAGFDGDLGTADDVDYGTVTTGADGLYLVGDLPPGDLRVDVDPATVPAGLAAGYDLDGGSDETAVRALDAGEDARDVDFGYHGEGSAGDLVWWDLDSDGAREAREPGLPQVRVTLAWPGFDGVPGNDDDASLTARTGADGDYLFTGLPAGDFTVVVDPTTLPPGLDPTADPDGGADSRSAFTLPAGGSDLDQDFGYAGPLELGDLVWFDTDRDGSRDDGEDAVGGADLTVTSAGADGETGTRDDVTIATRTRVAPADSPAARRADGGVPGPGDPSYLVTGLGPGPYVVALDPDSLGEDAPWWDADGGDPAETSVRLAGRSDLRADFGVFHNIEPEVAPQSISTRCGTDVLVDPAEGAVDANGDPLRVVPSSVVAPAGVDVSLSDAGLRLTTERGSDYTVSWDLADGRGGVATMQLRVDVDGACSTGTLPDTGSPVRTWWVGLGLLLLALGGGLVVAARRR